MIPERAALALSGLMALGGPVCVGGAAAQTPITTDSLRGPGRAVPFVAQGPLLCGGASLAMVQRYWGELGVYAEDYAELVSRDEGGIRTGALARALEDRGYQVRVLQNDPDAALARVRADTPVVALLETGEARYHYVVLVGVGPDRVRYHDPLKGPARERDRRGVLRRWAATGFWAMVAGPGPVPVEPDRGPAAGPAPTDPSTPLPPSLRDGLDALRAGRPATAAALAEGYLRATPEDDRHRFIAWQMLASARYTAGDRWAALEAWNRIDEPSVDLVQIRGLEATRYPVAVRVTGIRPRTMLTTSGLRRADRRLEQLPAVARARVAYRPLRDGSVTVEARVLERRRLPFGIIDLAGLGLGALVNRHADLELGPLLPVGERWRLTGGWREARSLAEGAVALPWAPLAAVVTVGAGWTEERYAGLRDRTRTWGGATVTRWVTADTRMAVDAGLERWDAGRRLGRVGLSVLWTRWADRVRLGATVHGWGGADGRWARARAAARARVPDGPKAWTFTLGGSVTSAGASPTVWDGAGAGALRAPLLRGHPLIRDGRIQGDAMGRGLVHGTLAWGWYLPAGPGTISFELFIDGARVWDPLTGDGPRSYADPGVELGVSSHRGAVALALARGRGEWVVSARVDAGTLPWLAVP
ncbi:MAG: papain-like cysteine protease family protein [Longimicrobiales bacterium]|nr:papain-like cysteine protease family protein [Longimicrobiales bacterium]